MIVTSMILCCMQEQAEGTVPGSFFLRGDQLERSRPGLDEQVAEHRSPAGEIFTSCFI